MYTEFIFKPLYNGLVAIMNIFPGIEVGLAVIIFTIIIKIILYPLSKKALLTQVRMKEVEPEMNKIKQQYGKDRQAQALKIMELYKEKKIKPFSSVLLLFIQLPILLGLISVFYKIVPSVNPEFLYSFLQVPTLSHPTLFGMDITTKSLILALITGVAQFFQLHYSVASRQHRQMSKNGTPTDPNDFSANLANSMNTQMKYMLPVIAFASVYWLIPLQFPQAASIIAIYWSISSLFTLGQELFIRKKYVPHVG